IPTRTETRRGHRQAGRRRRRDGRSRTAPRPRRGACRVRPVGSPRHPRPRPRAASPRPRCSTAAPPRRRRTHHPGMIMRGRLLPSPPCASSSQAPPDSSAPTCSPTSSRTPTPTSSCPGHCGTTATPSASPQPSRPTTRAGSPRPCTTWPPPSRPPPPTRPPPPPPHEIGPVDYILNLPSASHVDRSIADPGPFIRNNVEVMLTVLDYARQTRPRMLLQMGTDEEYGPAPAGYAHREWDTVLPSNPYSASKAAQSAIATAYWRTYQLPVVLTRTMNLIGPGQDAEKFVPMVIRRVLAGETVPIHSSPDG